jgi:16S rRNA (adenine1518-N6/adenine1519-N6)-dimethyltransferase
MLLKEYNLRANKRLGQNFLINEEVINEIVQKAEISEEDVVLEIGPGLGSLTKALLEKAKRVIAIELDDKMIDLLANRFNTDKLELIHGDILKINLKEIIDKYTSVKVVANLPYYITSPIVMKLLEERLKIKSIVVMVQKEVGERFCSEPNSKEYGAITLSIKYYSIAENIIFVPKENFLPAPEVDSCVIKLDILDKPSVDVIDEELFFKLIKLGFSQRRKTILNSLSSGDISRDKIKEVLDILKINENLRAENLSIYDFGAIANEIGRSAYVKK